MVPKRPGFVPFSDDQHRHTPKNADIFEDVTTAGAKLVAKRPTGSPVKPVRLCPLVSPCGNFHGSDRGNDQPPRRQERQENDNESQTESLVSAKMGSRIRPQNALCALGVLGGSHFELEWNKRHFPGTFFLDARAPVNGLTALA